MPKTQDEINALKQSWARDACWDIEETEGFEDHKEELLEFRRMTQADWKAKQDRNDEALRGRWYELKINESFKTPHGDFVIRVTGGWVMQCFSEGDGISSVFIPFSPP